MKERPIIFTAPMVRAILAGRKTMARRIVKLPRGCSWYGALGGEREGWWVDDSCPAWFHIDELRCPYGRTGERLWVRESFSGPRCMDAQGGCAAAPPSKWGDGSRIWYWADGNPDAGDWTKPRPGIHMPRWASRITLEIESVRVERLQDISETDALAEGVERIFPAGHPADTGPNHYTAEGPERVSLNQPTAVGAFRALWALINGEESWTANPWVWVLSFKRVTP